MGNGSFQALGCVERKPGSKLLLPLLPIAVGFATLLLPLLLPAVGLASVYGWLALCAIALIGYGIIWAAGDWRRSRSLGLYHITFKQSTKVGTVEITYHRVKDLNGGDVSTKEKEITFDCDFVKVYPNIPLYQIFGDGGGVPVKEAKATLTLGSGSWGWQLELGFASIQEMFKVSSELKGGTG